MTTKDLSIEAFEVVATIQIMDNNIDSLIRPIQCYLKPTLEKAEKK